MAFVCFQVQGQFLVLVFGIWLSQVQLEFEDGPQFLVYDFASEFGFSCFGAPFVGELVFEGLGVLKIFKHNSAAYFALIFWLNFDEFEFMGIFDEKTRPADIGISVADADVEGRVHDVGIAGVIVGEEVIQSLHLLPLEIKALAVS